MATLLRSSKSIDTYGANVSLHIRPDSAILVVRTALGYLITYSIATDPDAQIYKLVFPSTGSGQSKRQFDQPRGANDLGFPLGTTTGDNPFTEISLRFCMVIRVDAGINAVLALDDELVVATKKPAAVQCIRWTPDDNGHQTSTQPMSRMPWWTRKGQIIGMAYDRPMNILIWLSSDGRAYAVQKNVPMPKGPNASTSPFQGYPFHHPQGSDEYATTTAVNARFSLIAVGTAAGDVFVYTLRDYAGNVPLSHRLQPCVSPSLSGRVRFLTYSVDGYCLFAGLEHGWMTWSVFGKPGGNSFGSNQVSLQENGERWLGGAIDGSWIAGGSELLLITKNDPRVWILEFARGAAATYLSAANISRPLLVTRTGLMIYRGHELPDLTSISAEAVLWRTIQLPASYLERQGPVRVTVISIDGRYVAVAGRRGLAHYSIISGRWRTFDDSSLENEFAVRGGMCWHQHILVVAVETDDGYEVGRTLPAIE